MKTKEEIAANMLDRITMRQCFFGEDDSDADRQVYLNVVSDIRAVVCENPSVTVAAKSFFDEILGMEFDEMQWLSLTLIISTYIELAEKRGAKKLAEAMELLEGLK